VVQQYTATQLPSTGPSPDFSSGYFHLPPAFDFDVFASIKFRANEGLSLVD